MHCLTLGWNCLKERCKLMDAEFQDVFELSCEQGFRAIVDEARWQMRANPEALTDFVETLSALPDYYHRAMVNYHGSWEMLDRGPPASTMPRHPSLLAQAQAHGSQARCGGR